MTSLTLQKCLQAINELNRQIVYVGCFGVNGDQEFLALEQLHNCNLYFVYLDHLGCAEKINEFLLLAQKLNKQVEFIYNQDILQFNRHFDESILVFYNLDVFSITGSWGVNWRAKIINFSYNLQCHAIVRIIFNKRAFSAQLQEDFGLCLSKSYKIISNEKDPDSRFGQSGKRICYVTYFVERNTENKINAKSIGNPAHQLYAIKRDRRAQQLLTK